MTPLIVNCNPFAIPMSLGLIMSGAPAMVITSIKPIIKLEIILKMMPLVLPSIDTFAIPPIKDVNMMQTVTNCHLRLTKRVRGFTVILAQTWPKIAPPVRVHCTVC
jgi:hypothetical protein